MRVTPLAVGICGTDARILEGAYAARPGTVLGHEIAIKVVELPGGGHRAKPEFEDVRRVAVATGRSPGDIFWLASIEAERQ